MDYRIVLLLLLTIFGIFPLVFFSVAKNCKHVKIAFLILSILYSLVICVGVFTNVEIGKTITISLFKNVNLSNKSFNFNLIANNVQDFIINILMFIPLGFLLTPLFSKYTFLKTAIIGLGFAIFVEVMQLILPIERSPQLSDIILNSLSCIIGVGCFILLETLKSKLKSHKKKTI